MRTRITQDTLRRLTPGTDLWDDKCPGLVVRCHKSGRASYLVSLGRGRWHTLGKVGELTPDAARKLAVSVRGDVLKARALGQADPIVAQRRAKHAPTFKAYLENTYTPWLRQHRKRAEETLERLAAHFVPVFGNLKLNEITGFAVERWRSARLKDGIAPATVNRDIAGLRAALSRAVDWNLLQSHPLAKVKALKEDKLARVRYLQPDEDRRLRAALMARDDERRRERDSANAWRRERGYPEWQPYGTYTDHLTPLVLTALNTGLRFGELANLQWRDVDLDRAMLTVRGEGAKSGITRHVPLNSEAIDVLKAWRPSDAAADAYVFPGQDGGRLVDIKTAWASLLKRAKITGFRFHDCRHDFASKLVMNGTDLNTVRELLGHSDIKMVLRYAHLAPEHKAAAVARLVQR